MDWLPNEDAMVFFCRDVLPLIRKEEPDVTLSIVGRAPTPAVIALGLQHGVTVTGRVDDVRPYVRDAAVYIVPLRIGGGTRLKIFEAMAMAKAVVSTSVGAEGLPVTDGEHVWLADEPQASRAPSSHSCATSTAGGSSKRRRVRSSSSGTTGRRWPDSWNTR